jgi:subtilisin family serine protease
VNALDPANPGPVTADPNGHGTHVAGIIAALDDAQGVVGGAPGARLVPVRVLDANGAGWNSDVADAIRWAADIDTGNAAVISMSLGGPSSAAIAAAIHKVENDAGYTHPVIVAAAGNATCSGPQYPAALSSTTPEVIAVSALCKPGTTGSCPATTPFPADPYQLATFSSVVWNGSGTIRGLAAPGVAINSTWPSSGYATKSGTSMATPFVAAAAALVAAHCPAYGAADVVARLQSTAHDLGPAGPDKLYGAGMVDAQEAVALAC